MKQRLAIFSALISAFLYLIIGFDFLEQDWVWVGTAVIVIGLVNLVLMKSQVDSNKLNVLAHSLNALAAAMVGYTQEPFTQKWWLWVFIVSAYLVTTIIFALKYWRQMI